MKCALGSECTHARVSCSRKERKSMQATFCTTGLSPRFSQERLPRNKTAKDEDVFESAL